MGKMVLVCHPACGMPMFIGILMKDVRAWRSTIHITVYISSFSGRYCLQMKVLCD